MEMETIDWRLLSFVFATITYENWFHLRVPKIYYWDVKYAKK